MKRISFTQHLRKHYFTMYLCETHNIFKAKHPDVTISYPAFCKVKPKNALLLKNTPLDQCRCEKHKNFFFKLTALKIDYYNNFWEQCLCQGNSEDLVTFCWKGTCLQCSKGQKILFDNSDLPETVKYQEWILDDEQIRRRVERSPDDRISLYLLLLSGFPSSINIKRTQESSFEQIKSKSDIVLIQIDFAKAYSCEYQNKIQSAPWNRGSITSLLLHALLTRKLSANCFCLTVIGRSGMQPSLA